jgi:vacuolar-type H+-ATPase subunit H
MLPNILFQILTIAADIVLFLFVWYYLWELRGKEKWIEKERRKTDTNYHHVVDEALSKEQKIIDDATKEATQIIADTQFLTKTSTDEVDKALKQMEGEIEREAGSTSQEFTKTYSASLQKVATQSLMQFQTITKGMETELQKQTKEFRDTMLPRLEKDLEEYKKMKVQQTDRIITHIIQEVSQEILNKSLNVEDHQRLLIESLEKAKNEGAFD